MHSLGFDLGSLATKAVLLDGSSRVGLTLDRQRDPGDRAALHTFLEAVARHLPGERLSVGFTGLERGPTLPDQVLWSNSLLAVAAGVRCLHPEARGILEIGGHTAKCLVLDTEGNLKDFATNEACAAGTGSFLEQQARRLGLTAPELSNLAVQAPRGASIAGRCSVFANSDMIHLQQKGTSLPEIAYGLCLAIARNFLTTLMKGRGLEAPAILAGGCARNGGILRAFREVLGSESGSALQVSAYPGFEGAIGVAQLAQLGEMPALSIGQIQTLLHEALTGFHRVEGSLPRLTRRTSSGNQEEPATGPIRAAEGYLGLDVGSVSTDLVLLDPEGELLASIYLPTRGRPTEVLQEGLSALEGRLDHGFRVLSCGATGSGRHLAGKLAGADVVKNEITCQQLGAQHYVPEVDTILEIGGQDSKFIRVKDGAMVDFTMNKVCAAGTGSFLEEQSLALGVAIRDDFATRAFAADPTPDLGSRCTVFMETEVVGALAAGIPVEGICAGLAYSIVRNYLDKVVGSRPIGQHIVFQGGVASNGAVVAAFEEVLQQAVRVHPFNRISGAIGAALAAKASLEQAPRPSLFKGFRRAQAPTLRSFECHHCSNRCEVNVLESGCGDRAFFGDTCERYTSGLLFQASDVPNLAEEYVAASEALYLPSGEPGPRMGIPRATSLMGSLPFWAVFWKALGYAPVLSEPSSQHILARGLQHLSMGVCLPIKLTAGHVHQLLAEGIEPVFLPALIRFPGEDPAHAFACPYTMAAPYMVDIAGGTKGVAPTLRFDSEATFLAGFEPLLARLRVTRQQLALAFQAALKTQADFDQSFCQRAKRLLEAGNYRHAFAILGRPYSVFDPYVNLSLFERLRRMGVLAIPLPFLPREAAEGPESTLPWRFATDIHSAAAALEEHPSLHPVILSSFACGPDAFALPKLGTALRGRPHLVLEFDEHRGEAGLVTRLEAFLDQLEAAAPRPPLPAAGPSWSTATIPTAPACIRIPFFADCAYAFSGLFKAKGFDARILPRPSKGSRALGEKHSLGKECHAFSMVAGDLMQMATKTREKETVFFFPGTALPCLMHQYGTTMQAMLDELDIQGIQVSSPTGKQLLATFGFRAIERLYVGMLAIEILVKAVCQIRPYERVKGTTDRVHQDNLERLEAAIAGGDILDALEASLEAVAQVAKVPERDRPLVGIAGDIYTRVNPAANQDLAHWLEAQGLEVWPSPFQTDLLDFEISERLQQSLASHDLPEIFLHGPVALRRALHHWRVRYVVGSKVTRGEEPDYEAMKRLADPYMPNHLHELLFLNIAKIVDFAAGGADGIVNAICFGCMMGHASAAVIERIRKDFDGIPIITAVYAGGEDPSRRMMLETFVSQVKARHRWASRRRKATEPPSPSPGPSWPKLPTFLGNPFSKGK